MIAIRYEGSRVHKPWVVEEGEMRQIWPNDKPTWETDRILGTYNLQKEAAEALLFYHIYGKMPEERKEIRA